MASKIKVGDIVQLKSGGPAMTVESPDNYKAGRWECVWFRGASREFATFEEEVLKPYEAPKKDD